ncbi:ribosome-associated heat shock protein Hsp15 [Sansalvadorimonas verongulae]|uniref:ribosome-associated heat shock protein Hsp15 n=1 Tax=Sansalvadorimonas verongulae TaxID=2172824 RepID=UPI0012BBCBC2|nr:ribosome-associated heat shock protein Hsp15 [Sansalvadorimonas verongulae]MTI14069.1 ribosome-associated heat shock protein Hsp15 [Sansalvadorimonas verongulae]
MSKRKQKAEPESTIQSQSKVRLDKWLWAARFYKTRAISRDAIEGGKVHVNGQRAKPSKDARVGDMLVLRQGFDEKTIVIKELSDSRRGAPEAQKLYTETQASINKREEAAANRRALRGSHPFSEHRPDKKQRRDIDKLRQQDFEA